MFFDTKQQQQIEKNTLVSAFYYMCAVRIKQMDGQTIWNTIWKFFFSSVVFFFCERKWKHLTNDVCLKEGSFLFWLLLFSVQLYVCSFSCCLSVIIVWFTSYNLSVYLFFFYFFGIDIESERESLASFQLNFNNHKNVNTYRQFILLHRPLLLFLISFLFILFDSPESSSNFSSSQ